MFNKYTILALIFLCLVPALAWPQDLECPEMDQVLAAVGGPAVDLDTEKVAGEVGGAATDDKLRGFAAELRNHVPDASDAEISNILIAAYCEYLTTMTSDTNAADSLKKFENVVLATDFHNGDEVSYDNPDRDHGWLMKD